MTDHADSDVGPDKAPPSLPTGWIAQWDANSRKYYFVQISTGVSTWETPTEEAPTVPTPGSTPAQTHNPYSMPQPDGRQNGEEASQGLGNENAQEGERGLGSMAVNAMLHSNKYSQSQQSSSGFGGLAQQFLGGSHSTSSNTGSGSSSGAGNLVNQLAGSLLGGSKPQNPQQYSSSGQSSSGGMLGSLLGGHQNPSNQQQGYGYSTNASSNGVYSGQAPPSSYQPSPAHHTGSHQYNQPGQYGSGPQYSQSQYGQSQQYGSMSTPPSYSQSPSGQYGQQASNQYGQHNQGGFGQHQGPPHHPDMYGPQHAGFQPGGYGQPAAPMGSHPGSPYGQNDQYSQRPSQGYGRGGPPNGGYGGGYSQGGGYGQQGGNY